MLIDFELKKPPSGVEINGRFDEKCILKLSNQAMQAIKGRRLKLHIFQMGSLPLVSDVQIEVNSTAGNITAFIGGGKHRIVLGENTSGNFNILLWRSSSVLIAESSNARRLRIVCDMSEVKIGPDCLISDDILLQAADQHGVVDLQSGTIINNKKRSIIIGEHVWIGRRCTVLPDVSIGKGSIIGAGAVVTSDLPEMCVSGGIPAKVIKTDTTWSRSPIELDSKSLEYIDQFRKQRH